jgi:hypothetical protein
MATFDIIVLILSNGASLYLGYRYGKKVANKVIDAAKNGLNNISTKL